jgi:competence protein ComEA
MSSDIRGALSRLASRAKASPYTKPLVRVALAAGALVILALIGSRAGAMNAGTAALAPAASAPTSTSTPFPTPASTPTPTPASASASTPTPTAFGPASTATPDSPVVLNTATEEDLRRLPGIGAKRAAAILALRVRLGRFRALEDLLKVKGIGRATLKRLRPLVRLDGGEAGDAGGMTRPP